MEKDYIKVPVTHGLRTLKQALLGLDKQLQKEYPDEYKLRVPFYTELKSICKNKKEFMFMYEDENTIDLSCFTDLESKDFEYGHIATKTLLKKEPCEQYDSGLILTKSWSYKTWVYELTFIDGWQSDNTISFYFK